MLSDIKDRRTPTGEGTKGYVQMEEYVLFMARDLTERTQCCIDRKKVSDTPRRKSSDCEPLVNHLSECDCIIIHF